MSEKTLYIECTSGISGDMTVAALLDLGADEQVLRDALASLPLSGYEIRISTVKKSGLRVRDFDVVLAEDNHDHDMNYLYPSDLSALQDHAGHSHAPHAHRTPKEIDAIIDAGKLTDHAKELAHRIFDILAEAEAQAHGVEKKEVHFHEVGAVDSIIDIVSAAVCIDNLAPQHILASPLCEGRGQVRCQHGLLPVPVPAVANIAAKYRLLMRALPIEGELVTPTGAAIIAAVTDRDEMPENYRILGTGMGAGKRDYGLAGFVRVMLLEEEKLSTPKIHENV